MYCSRRVAATAVICTALVPACSRGAPNPEGAAATTERGATTTQEEKLVPSGSPTIEVVHIVERAVKVTLEMPGELEPYETVTMFPKVTGFVKTIRVDRGSRVRAGELMAELEAPELVAQGAEAESKLQAAEAQLGVMRSKADADGSTFEKLKAAAVTPGVVAGNDLVLAQKTVEADQNQIAAAQRNVDAARQALNSITQMQNYLRVTAPFDGVVTERNVHPGALVGPSSGAGATTPMLRVVNRLRLRLVVPVPEAYIAGVSEGVEMPFSVPAYPGETFAGKVARIAQEVDTKTRTMAVEIDIQNNDGRLTPGTFCRVQWRVRRPGPSLLAPSASIASTTGRTFVVRIRNGQTEWVDVKTGLAVGSLVEVFGGLRSGDQIAARGTDEIRPGTQMRVKEVRSPAS
jgi:RND family efflux transporter MFP subunit